MINLNRNKFVVYKFLFLILNVCFSLTIKKGGDQLSILNITLTSKGSAV